MEYGLISRTVSSDFNTTKNIQELNHIEPTNQNVSNEADLNSKINELSDVKKANNNNDIQKYHEVILANTNFGFNDNSKDFFVKVTRGVAENKYPTENMMRMKEFLMHPKNDVS